MKPRDIIAKEIWMESDRWDLDDEGLEAADSIIAALDRAGYAITPSDAERNRRYTEYMNKLNVNAGG